MQLDVDKHAPHLKMRIALYSAIYFTSYNYTRIEITKKGFPLV